MDKIRLKLFVTGRTARSETAVANLHRLSGSLPRGQCEWVVVDVLENPGLAEDLKILVTPTLIKEFPPPARRIIGDLSNLHQVMNGLMPLGRAPGLRSGPPKPGDENE